MENNSQQVKEPTNAERLRNEILKIEAKFDKSSVTGLLADFNTKQRYHLLQQALKHAVQADAYRTKKENNTRPADLLSDKQRERIDAYRRSNPGVAANSIAKSLGLSKEYVADYLRSL